MAVKFLYQIRDRVAGVVTGPIFPEYRDGSAVRQFADLVYAKQGPISEHPADYDLLCVGQQDDESGEIASCDPRVVANGQDLVRSDDAVVATK